MQVQNRGASHNCQGPRCVCQRYENGELAAVIMNQGRNNQEREDSYQNVNHVSRAFQNRASNAPQVHPNLNPNYQNPIDLIRNYNRRPQQQQQQEPEENIYERLDNEDDEDDDENAEVPRNEPLAPNNQGNADNHTYERIDERISCSNSSRAAHCRYYKYHGLNHSLLNDVDGARNANQYDQPRHIYIDYSRLSGNFYQNPLSRLGRNCFSTENIAYASTRRSVQPLVYNCTCPYCRHVDTRYVCHHCHNLHNKLRYQDNAGNSRHYVYQVARNCRCPFCRGEYPYMKLPANALRAAEFLKMECCHRNPAGCTCRGKIPLDSSSAINFGRYLDWINRTGQSVNNPLYAMIHLGRMDRASILGYGNASSSGSQPTAVDPGPSTSSGASNARFNDPNSSSILRSVFASGASTSNASICPMNRYVERQHTCDDSCIRNQSGSLGICQLLGRCERTECNHGRLSVHWWFVNKWLPLWNSHSLDRNADGGPPCVDEVAREQRESDSDDS